MYEFARAEVPAMPLDVLVAMTEGSLGYILQQSLLNELRKRQMRRYVVTVVTQVVVERGEGPPEMRVECRGDESLGGIFFSQIKAQRLKEQRLGQSIDDHRSPLLSILCLGGCETGRGGQPLGVLGVIR